MHPPGPRRRPLSRLVIANPEPARQRLPPLPPVLNSASVPPTNRGEPWFDDGNVLLVAQDTAFRVYRGLLARRATVFTNLFMLPEAEDEIVEGCAVVRLKDSATDLAHFLTAVYNGRGRQLNPKSRDEFAVLVSILRMADKYDAASVRREVLPLLQIVYPDNLADLDELWKGGNSESIGFADPIQGVHLARETSALALLPAAMVRLTSHNFLRGIPLRKHFIFERLGAEDLRGLVLLVEHDRLTNARIMRIVRSRAKDLSWRNGCDRPRGRDCVAEFPSMFQVLAENLVVSEQTVSCVDFATVLRQVLDGRELCHGCREALEKEIAAERMRWWNEIPSVLGFSGWNDARLRN